MDFLLEQKRDRDTMDRVISFRGEVRDVDLVRLALDPLDRALLNGMAKTPADNLLVLEMIFRRYAEQTPNSKIDGLEPNGESHAGLEGSTTQDET